MSNNLYNKFNLYAESFKKVIDMYETLDILVNIAGIMDDADWEIMVDVNYVRDFCILYINLIQINKYIYIYNFCYLRW